MLSSDTLLHMRRLKAKRKSFHDSSEKAGTIKFLPFYVRTMTKLADCERCHVFINDPGQNKVWLKAGTGVDEREIEFPMAGSVVGDVITSGTAKIVNNLEFKSGAHKQVDEKTGFMTRNILCVPIKSAAQNEVSGAFQLLNKIGGRDFTSEDQPLAEEVAEHLQKEIDAIYLDQKIFGFTERLYSYLAMATKFFIASVVLIFMAALGVLALWILAPLIVG